MTDPCKLGNCSLKLTGKIAFNAVFFAVPNTLKHFYRYHLALILIGQFISGVGTIPLFAFPPAIFRETLKEKHIPMCLALWQVSVFIGPMIAFAISEPILETWVDITEVLLSEHSRSFTTNSTCKYTASSKPNYCNVLWPI